MTKEHLIPAIEFCSSHGIELSYINSLHRFGLIEIITIKKDAFLYLNELPKLEQILLFHNELEINLEGIEVIINLLERVDQIQYEMNALKNKLRLYENL